MQSDNKHLITFARDWWIEQLGKSIPKDKIDALKILLEKYLETQKMFDGAFLSDLYPLPTLCRKAMITEDKIIMEIPKVFMFISFIKKEIYIEQGGINDRQIYP